ncbi:MAG: class I SAM-dependent methyltransferase [Oscillospiraceae bacterium]|nr:class I SAM-dependent methyltransferase [Oscillospiraceae bacterium]
MGIYVWGTGCGAGDLAEQGLASDRITAFVDNAPTVSEFLGRPVIVPEELDVRDVELMVVASRHSLSIRDRCLALGIESERLLFLKNHYVLKNLNENESLAEELLGTELVSRIRQRCHVIRAPMGCADEVLERKDLENDYVRVKTLEMICRRLRDIPGAAAELGVYRGAFARCINMLLPDRTLYLFDSFAGFEDQEIRKEKERGTCGDGFVAAHRNTAVEQVLSWMPHRERIRVCPGFFPESLNGLEERFCLVSLDVDFEESTYEGLKYFWPRMNPGGIILLHDYNSPTLSGVRRAVARYERDFGVHLPGVPLCDINGTLVLVR